jgi:hypothetical protein
MDATPQRFVALARSSPWRWRTLRMHVLHGWDRAPFRALVRRPDGLRVETLEGTLVRAERQAPNRPVRFGPGGMGEEVIRPWAYETAPALGDDGLVRRRPSEHQAQYDDPMLQDYRWVAMLDPVELADGHGRWRGEPEPDPVVVDVVRAVDHHGREAWEATVRPTPAYDPRCPCCPLLFSAESAALDAAAGGSSAPAATEEIRYPDSHRIRLDVATGVCVGSEEVGGSRPGWGHEVAIEAVDEPVPDALFVTQRRAPFQRFRR